MSLDDDEEGPAPADGDEDEEEGGEGKEPKMKEVKEEKEDDDEEEKEEEEKEKEKETPMEQEAEDELDPLDAYMEEVKEEVKKFNMGAMKGDKVRLAVSRRAAIFVLCYTSLFFYNMLVSARILKSVFDGFSYFK